eukprot:CAMPEP_0178466054 /NCGR_PEP_ID=MMETSP0689_2-20121128/51697_1 /TAXON_ID=160604 /ORGANISM="Amphidinium massartii, Strain CS-259" /LENGTH=56 /DNA_ID=CAMNT_0020093049 /DNA_START=23 /DNA_END=189 /DNA_ORIENTATION=+
MASLMSCAAAEEYGPKGNTQCWDGESFTFSACCLHEPQAAQPQKAPEAAEAGLSSC